MGGSSTTTVKSHGGISGLKTGRSLHLPLIHSTPKGFGPLFCLQSLYGKLLYFPDNPVEKALTLLNSKNNSIAGTEDRKGNVVLFTIPPIHILK